MISLIICYDFSDFLLTISTIILGDFTDYLELLNK